MCPPVFRACKDPFKGDHVRYAIRGLLAALTVLMLSLALRADDEQTAYEDIGRTAQAQLTAESNSQEAINRAVVAQTEKVYAKCEDYLKRFPEGAHHAEVRLVHAEAMLLLASNMEAHRALLDRVPATVAPVLAAKTLPERTLRARLALLRYNLGKQGLAKTPEEGKPFEADAIKQAEAIVAESPTHAVIPQVLGYLSGAYEHAGRPAESAAVRERLAKEFPETQPGQMAVREIKQRALKGTTMALTFTSTTGEDVNLKDYRGKVVVIEFWASWCPPCRAGMPFIVRMAKDLREKGLRMIGISLDQDKAALDAYMKEQGMTWPQYFDGKVFKTAFADRFSLIGVPTTYLFDKSGVLREIGLRDAALETAVKKLLDEPK